jgi:SWI/SNF-related matrix-associated actin-dependent regulator of chromatin subfamily A member 5
LLSYLAPDIFKDSETFDVAFDLGMNGKQSVDRDMLSKAHYMLRPFILRRLKTEVEKALPPKLETKILCPMSEMQIYWIKSLLLKEKDSLEKASGPGDVSAAGVSDWRKLNSLMAQLRKAANHPYLFDGAEPPTLDGRAGPDIITASGKMMVLDRLLTKLKEGGHRVVLFSQYTRTLDIISDYLIYRGYDSTCRLDGQTNRVMREVYINMFNKKDSKKFIFLLSTRAGGEGVNLFTADTGIYIISSHLSSSLYRHHHHPM